MDQFQVLLLLLTWIQCLTLSLNESRVSPFDEEVGGLTLLCSTTCIYSCVFLFLHLTSCLLLQFLPLSTNTTPTTDYNYHTYHCPLTPLLPLNYIPPTSNNWLHTPPTTSDWIDPSIKSLVSYDHEKHKRLQHQVQSQETYAQTLHYNQSKQSINGIHIQRK